MSGILKAKTVVYCACIDNFNNDVERDIELRYDTIIEKIKNTSSSSQDCEIAINLDSFGELHSESEDVPAIKISYKNGDVAHIHYDHGNILTGTYPYYVYGRDESESRVYHFLIDDAEYRCYKYCVPSNRNNFYKWNNNNCKNSYEISGDSYLFLSDDSNIIAEFPCNDGWNCKFKFAD